MNEAREVEQDVYTEVIRAGHIPFEWKDRSDGDVHYPISTAQFKHLIGRVLTHIDAMGLPGPAHLANKTLIKKTLWAWWEEAQHNSLTSAQGCIAPISIEDWRKANEPKPTEPSEIQFDPDSVTSLPSSGLLP